MTRKATSLGNLMIGETDNGRCLLRRMPRNENTTLKQLVCIGGKKASGSEKTAELESLP